MTGIERDITHACRTLRSQPAYAAAVVLLLALGIGASTAAFSAVDGILWVRFPYADADRLVRPVSLRVPDSGVRASVSYADYRDWRAMRDVFASVALYRAGSSDLTGAGAPETIGVMQASAEYFATLGLQPALGRTLRAEDSVPGGPLVGVISHSLWQQRFGGARDCVGRTARLAGQPVEIVGVMPPSASFQSGTSLWVPLQANPADPDNNRRDNLVWRAVARLAPGVSLDTARSRVKGLADRLARDLPAVRRGWTNDLVPLREAVVSGSTRRTTVVLFGAVVALLLVACVNIAGLLLARVSARQREMAIRTAIGATRGRLVIQLLTESLLLAAVGCVAGILVARAALAVVSSWLPEGILLPGAPQLAVNGRVLAFAVTAACASALLFGLLPAWLATSARAEASLRVTTGAGIRRRTLRARSALVAAELAVTLALLVGAGLLVKSFVRIQTADTGIRSDHLLTAGLSAPQGRYDSDPRVKDLYDSVLGKVRSIPGVTSAAAVSRVPVGGPGLQLGRSFVPEGAPEPPAGPDYGAEWSVVTPGYFEAAQVPIVRGRAFTDRDRADSPPVTIISEAMARRLFGARDPIGRRIQSWRDEKQWREVVGVARDVRYFGASSEWQPLVYVPHAQDSWRQMRLLVRTAGDPLAIAGPLRQALAEVDPDLPLSAVSSVEQYRLESMAEPRLAAAVLGSFGGVALLLAAIGLLGLMSSTVAMRTREFGLRLALGARGGDLVRMVVGRGAALTAVGLSIGAGAAYALSRALESLLFEVTATDQATFASMAAVLAATAIAASVIPAWRAVRIDPAVTLRAE